MITYSDFKIYKIDEILKDIVRHIEIKAPFSLIRFGDGGIKFLHAIYYNDDKQLEDISEREGIPMDKFVYVLEEWGRCARSANYIDTPEVYFTPKFWPKIKKQNKEVSKKTITRMRMWRDLYSRGEFDNLSFCNPEVNYLLCLRMPEKRNLIDIMEGKKICCICTTDEIIEKVPMCDMDVIKIVGHFEDQYNNSFHHVVDEIKNRAMDYDMWFIAAGELGRIYSGMIKDCGGIAIDMGFVIDYWINGEIPHRLLYFIETPKKRPLEFKLNSNGMKYSNFL